MPCAVGRSQCKARQGGAREAYKRRRGAEDLRSISRRVASFPGGRSLVRVVPGHRSTALCTFFASV